MGKKNWIEFEKEENTYEQPKEENPRKIIKIKDSGPET